VKKGLISAAFAVLTACSGGSDRPPSLPPSASAATAWVIGPIIDGENYSKGTPLHPISTDDGFAVPVSPTAQPHYVTYHNGSLLGKHTISMRFRVEGDSEIIPVTGVPGSPAILSLYIQRKGDDWSGTGKYEGYRWYSTYNAVVGLKQGEYSVTSTFDGAWTSVQDGSGDSFANAWNNADNVGFVLGGGTGYGHGIYATGNVRIVVTEFKVS
jgi:hypothetical protein